MTTEIDREAEEADVVMPTAENAPPALFRPRNGITTTDVLEIALMYLLQLTGNPGTFPPGALRHQPMDAARVAMLSPEAQRHMSHIQQEATNG
ncbi:MULTISPECIES: hypothetical protein [Methylobacterium]|jgi:hypothetical protein|uniref:Uncharacterized protein n=2 Tax=Pseudomonadota TaxID=1224 RepID=A0ABQ4T1B9_9HYPH|nr:MULTISPECIES: hypothetical protein [Methylobacterium]PIU05271.1 MAG: hypothetical protein COT56_15905 [Methylobacterium sp. CG09_land_8_20_14_0_10_71_15]PIU12333.1 MAG: hypothetical protein COT28_15185 [Methylobacterium sp. CG08_land_8_20_14_0_20_71_15]GBU16837.1 hypothetical protein AwMethylo_10520 [Methylobacterium sp.]GJE08015.1 hypothetical protein AOPFMNJM_3347 [Methylobacterium jeotgali]